MRSDQFGFAPIKTRKAATEVEKKVSPIEDLITHVGYYEHEAWDFTCRIEAILEGMRETKNSKRIEMLCDGIKTCCDKIEEYLDEHADTCRQLVATKEVQ